MASRSKYSGPSGPSVRDFMALRGKAKLPTGSLVVRGAVQHIQPAANIGLHQTPASTPLSLALSNGHRLLRGNIAAVSLNRVRQASASSLQATAWQQQRAPCAF